MQSKTNLEPVCSATRSAVPARLSLSLSRSLSLSLSATLTLSVALLPSTGCINRSLVGEILHGGGTDGSPPGDDDGGGIVASGGRSGSGKGSGGALPYPDGGLSGDRQLTSASKLDVLFMIDDSSSMKPLQAKLAKSIPSFTKVLQGLPGGLPDLHVAVISSSVGAGAYGDVPGCGPGSPGDDGGRFQHLPGCGLPAGQSFVKASAAGSIDNFTGTLDSVVSCLTQLGDGGCGFEHQLESTRQAIIKSSTPNDPDNAGFLRDDAYLAVVMLTNEDDCSVPATSQLFDTSVQSVNDQPPLGGLWSYRCNEFGHVCDQPLPHDATGLPMTLTNCRSAENSDGLYHLTPVADFVSFLLTFKRDPNQVFVAALTGPSQPYTVHAHSVQLSNGATEMQPEIVHSCTAADGSYADPAVRLSQFIGSFGPNGAFESLCADDLGASVTRIAQQLVGVMHP
jgi:hypothetical protein